MKNFVFFFSNCRHFPGCHGTLFTTNIGHRVVVPVKGVSEPNFGNSGVENFKNLNSEVDLFLLFFIQIRKLLSKICELTGAFGS